MKRLTCILFVFALIVGMTACGNAKKVDNQKSAPPSENAEKVKEADQYSEIKQCFSFDNANIKVRKRDKRIEVAIIFSDFSTDAEPENWEDIISSLEAAMADAEPLAEAEGFTVLSAQLETTDGTILASGYDQKMQFDFFHTNTTYKETGNGLITLSIFNQLKTGMTYAEVRDLIGADGVLTSSVDVGDYQYKTETYTWDGDGDFGANAIIMFQGGGLTSKAQYGLK